MMNKRNLILYFIAVAVIGFTAIAFIGCNSKHNQLINRTRQAYPIRKSAWPGPVQQITPSFVPDCLEFSSDSSLLCAYSRPHPAAGLTARRMVYDLQGHEIRTALDEEGLMTSQTFPLFSRSIPKASQHYSLISSGHNPVLAKDLPNPGLFKSSFSWRISQDAREALLLTGRTKEKEWMNEESKTIELWQLKPGAQKRWAVDLPEGMDEWIAADFIEREGKHLVVVANRGQFYLLDHESGRIAERFTFKEEWSEEELAKRAAKIDPGFSDYDKDWYLNFKSRQADIDVANRLLAAGVTYGRRIKVISLDPPFKTIRDLNTYDHPYGWDISRVNFAGSRTLVVEYEFAMAGGQDISGLFDKYLFFHSTDIYDLQTGKRVWRENSNDRFYVTLSPDGRKIAILRRDKIEIGDFKPQNPKGSPQ